MSYNDFEMELFLFLITLVGAFSAITYLYQETGRWWRRRQGLVGDPDLAQVERRLAQGMNMILQTIERALPGGESSGG